MTSSVEVELLVGLSLVGVHGVASAIHVRNEAALAVHVVLDGADGAIGLVQGVLALGLLAVTVLRLGVEVVVLGVLNSVLVFVLGVLKQKFEYQH